MQNYIRVDVNRIKTKTNYYIKEAYTMEYNVTNVIKFAAENLLTILSDEEAEEIKQKLIDSGALQEFITELQDLIFEKMKESS